MKTTNAAGLDLIKTFEGLKLNAYKDIVGVWTIGYGHTATAKQGQVITQAQAETLLRQDLKRFENYVNSLPGADKLNDNQFSALVSLAFNVGSFGNGLKTAIATNPEQVPYWIEKYNMAGGKVIPGLTRRRKAEAALYESGSEKKKP
jgi:GH24 family phage-related lysozyme (muramidase)